MNKLIKNILDNTLILAKTLDFFEEFKTPGKDYKIIACQASEVLVQKYPDVYVDEVIKRQRTIYNIKAVIGHIAELHRV